jgi:hypothetical protein
MEALQDLLKKKRQSQDGEDVETFGGYLDLPEGYMEMFDNYLKNAREILDGTDVDTSTPLAYMSSEQLRDLDFLISTLMHSIRQMNTLTENGRFHTAIEAAHNTWDSLRGIAEYSLKRDSAKRFLQWDNTTPFYAFRRFGEGGRAVFEGLQEGWDRFAFNVSDWPDINELYVVADALCTDYSSVFFDYSNTRRPIYFLWPDLEHYGQALHGFYLDPMTLPGPKCMSNEEFIDAFKRNDQWFDTYGEEYAEFRQQFCPLDDGHAAERVLAKVIG